MQQIGKWPKANEILQHKQKYKRERENTFGKDAPSQARMKLLILNQSLT